MTTTGRKNETGAVAILTAIFLTVFVSILAVTVDIAHVRAKRADAQGTADNAALAAAWRNCKGLPGGDSQAAAQDVASDNGYTTGVTTVPEGTNAWRVTIDTGIATTFARALGNNNLNTSVTALASANCTPGGPGKPVVHASGTCSAADMGFKIGGNYNRYTGNVETGHDLQWSGNNLTVYGDVHANTKFKVNGNTNRVTSANSPDTLEVETGGGDVTWVSQLDTSGSGNSWGSINQVSSRVMTPPYAWTVGQFQSGGSVWNSASVRYSGSSLPSGVLRGLYVLSADKVELEDRTTHADGATIVLTHASGQVVIKGRNTLKPYVESLLFATWGTGGSGDCAYKGIEMPGDDNNLSGVLYTPNAKVDVAGTNNKVQGASVSRSVELSGENNVWIASTGGSLPTAFIQILQ